MQFNTCGDTVCTPAGLHAIGWQAPRPERLAAAGATDGAVVWRQAQCIVFGHALLEQLVYPRKPLAAHVYQAQEAIKNIANIDAWLAQDLQASHLQGKPFVPLPVLGIALWWPANENFSFYDDSFVFRPARPLCS
ncbi:DUF3025 domain-containing protein [Acidovorax sp. HDW3]|uniref:DUF3025 domain-containing protein n=1 Tax=Acidovorax sp. HDW3 TaxID=2714923 RepID=UPI00140E63AB|nr:DUF3025 domain-containing protein [Acidovorax sp. HDW3]